MKKLIICLFTATIALPCFSQADLPKNADGKYEYSAVVNVDSASADKLYSNTKLFVVDAFKSGKDVTQLNDDDAKTVAGTGSMKIYFKGISMSAVDKFVKFKFFIQCKDGRYKYTFTNFEFAMIGTQLNATVPLEDDNLLKHYVTKNLKVQLFNQVSENMNQLILNLKKTLASQTAITKDW